MPSTPGADSLRLLPIHLAATVAPASTVTLRYPVGNDATVVALRIRIYAGSELALQLVPYVVNGREQRRALVQFVNGGKAYIDGDDDLYTFALSEPVDADSADVICIDAVNLDTVNAYSFAVDMSLDFSNGQFPGVNQRA